MQGKLACLDVGADSCLHDLILMDGLQFTRTVLETDFGEALCDVNYFDSLTEVSLSRRLYICM